MATEHDLTEQDEQVLEAISRLENADATPTIASLARETDLSTDEVEAATGRLTDADLIRERRVELDADAVGAGREYTVRARG